MASPQRVSPLLPTRPPLHSGPAPRRADGAPSPHRTHAPRAPPPPGPPVGHRRYSRHQLALAARLRSLLDDGHTLASAEVILGLQDELADARADSERLQATVDRLRARDADR